VSVFPGGNSTGSVIYDVITSPNGTVFALAKSRSKQLIWSGLNESGPGQELALKISGNATKIALGPDASIWLVGNKTDRILKAFKLILHANVYLGHFDQSGKVLMEKIYDDLPNSYVWGIASLPPKNLVMVGRDRGVVDKTYRIWLRKIAPDGKVIWERTISRSYSAGYHLHSIVATLSDGTISVATPEADYVNGHFFREHLVLLLYAEDGTLIRRMRIRESLHPTRPSRVNSDTVAMVTNGNNIYVMSNAKRYLGRVTHQTEITKIAAASGISWTTTLPSAGDCEASLGTKPNGGLLVGCVYEHAINLYDLNEQTGQATRTRIAVPACENGITRVFVLPSPDGQVDLVGTLSRYAMGDSCNLYGRVTGSGN
jgi:hypothetical protein